MQKSALHASAARPSWSPAGSSASPLPPNRSAEDLSSTSYSPQNSSLHPGAPTAGGHRGGLGASLLPAAAAPPVREPYVPSHDPNSLKLADASARTTECNPGPAQAAFVERELMTVVAPALAKLLEGKPANPVHELTTQLRDAVAEARRRPSGRRGDTLGAVASMTVPVLLDSASAPPSLNHTLTQRPLASPGLDGRPQTAEEAATERQWRHDLHFVSRPCAPPAGRPLPARFQRSGQHPVFGMDLPTVKELSLVVRHLVAETGAKHIKWVIAGVGDVLIFQNGRPYRATPTPQQWQALRERVDSDEGATQSATGRRSAYSVGDPVAMHAALEAECIKSIQQSVKALQAAEARRNARRAARENAAAATTAGEPADVLLSVTVAAEAERATTPATPQRSRYAGAMDNSVISFESAVKAATAEIRNVSHSFAHFQHPDDAVSPPVVAETVTSLCDGIRDRHNTAVVIVGSDRWALVRHLQALFTLYFVVESEVQHVKRLINASDAAAGASQQTFAADVKKEVASRRRLRDDRREWLVKAHAAALHEGSPGGGSGEAATILERRTGIKQQRNQRRRKDDVKRKEVDELQREHARRKIGGLTRIYRRKRSDAAAQGAAFTALAPTFGSRSCDAGSKGHEQQAKDRRTALLATQYREGEFPLIRKLLDALMEGFGLEFITDEPPMSASAKAFRQWSVSFRRVEPVDDLDVSSEEEEWSSSMAERVRHTVHTAFNPLHDAQMALKLSGSDDLRYMADIFDTCAGLASLQRKAMHAMERLGSMVQFAAFLGFHHKRRLSAEFGTVIQSPLMSQLLRLPHKLQNVASPSYSDFLTASSAGQALLNHGCWVTPFLVNQPSLLHRPSSTRLLLGAPTPNGAFIPSATIPANPEDAAAEGSARAALPDMLQHLNPKTHLFLAPEHLTIDQWTDAVASALKRANGARRVLWLNTRPDMTVFVNEVPLVAAARPEQVGHDSAHLPLYSSIRTANVNGSNPPAYLRSQGPLNVPGPADAFLNKQQAAVAKVNPSRSGPASRRGSGSHGNVVQNARDMTLRSPTPTLGMDGTASEATGVTTVGALRRQKDHPSKDQPLPSGWLSLNIDSLERELCSEVMDMMETSEDGKLQIFTADAMVAGPGVPVAAVNTTLPDRPTQPVISTAAAAPSLSAPGTTGVSPTLSPMGNARDFGKGGFPLPGTVLPPIASEPASPLAATKVPPRSVSPTPSARSEQPGAAAAAASPLGASVNMGASTQEPGRSNVSGAAGAPTASELTAAIAAQGCAFPPLEDREAFVKPHTLQVLRTRTKAPANQPGQSFQSGPSGAMGQRGSAWSSSLHPNATQSLAVGGGDGETDPSSSPANRSGAPTSFGANADSLSFQVDTGSESSQRVRTINDKASDRASVARSLAPHRKTVRGVQMMRNRQGSVQSVLSDGHVADEDDSMLRLPSKASDACLTPWQAADEVRLRLKRRYSLDNAVQYRRAPMFRSNGPEWLKAIDQLYHLAHAQLADPYLAVVFGVSDGDSLFPAVVCTIVWAVEHGKQAMLGVPESNLTGGNWETNTNGGFDATLFAAGTSNQLDFTVTPEQQPHSPFGTVHRLVEQHLKTEMHESLKFVDVLLQQTGLSEAIVAPIEHFMSLAEGEAAKLPKDRPPTLPERQLMLWFAKKATQALERYVLLILFHHFVRFVQEQRQVMSVMQVDFSFAEHIASLPGVLTLLDDLDPWEGRADRSPLSPFSVAATANMRWRTRNWIATIG